MMIMREALMLRSAMSTRRGGAIIRDLLDDSTSRAVHTIRLSNDLPNNSSICSPEYIRCPPSLYGGTRENVSKKEARYSAAAWRRM